MRLNTIISSYWCHTSRQITPRDDTYDPGGQEAHTEPPAPEKILSSDSIRRNGRQINIDY